MGEIRSGEHFYSLDPAGERTFLVQFRESPDSGKTDSFWKSNTIHQPVLLYKDWYQVRDKEKEFSSSSFEIPFLEIFALPIPTMVQVGSKINLVLVSRGPKRLEKIHVAVDGEYLLSFDADFTEGPTHTFSLAVQLAGRYALFREVNGREVEILSFTTDRPPVPLMSLERNRPDAQKRIIPFAWKKESLKSHEDSSLDEALYFSLREVLEPDSFAQLDFSIYEKADEPKSFGITRLLNAIKLLPKQEELKLIQQLFQEDFLLGEYLLAHYFPYDLVFYLRKGILSDILGEIPGILLNLVVRNEEKFRRETIIAALDPIKAKQLDALSQVPVKETDIRRAKESFLSFCRAWLQKEFGIILNIRKIRNQVYTVDQSQASQTGLESWELGGRLVHLGLLSTGRFRSPEVLVWNRVSESAPFCIPICKLEDGLFLRFEQDFAVVQIVKDSFSLVREEQVEWRDIKAGQMIRIGMEGRMARLKIGCLDQRGLKEAMFDIIICGTLGTDIMLATESEEAEYPVRLLKSEGKSEALFSSSFFNQDFLISRNEIQRCSATEEDLHIRCSDAPLVWHLYMDISRMAARVELRTNGLRLQKRSAIQQIIPPYSGDVPSMIYRFAFEEEGLEGNASLDWESVIPLLEDRYRKSGNALSTAFLTMLTYRQFVLTGGDGLKDRLGFHLRKLNRAVHSSAYLGLEERLHIYFLLKEMFQAAPSYLKLWIDSMLTALFTPVEEDDSQSAFSRLMYDYIRSLLHLGEVSKESRGRLLSQLKESSQQTDDPIVLLRIARLLDRSDSSSARKTMRKLEGKSWETDLFFWEPFFSECLSLMDEDACTVRIGTAPSIYQWNERAVPEHLVEISTKRDGALVEFSCHLRNSGNAPELILVHGGGLEFCSASDPDNAWKFAGSPENSQIRSFFPSRDKLTVRFYLLEEEAARLRIFYRDCLDSTLTEMLYWQP